MKRLFLFFLIFISFSATLFAQSIDKPIVKIEYEKSSVITEAMLTSRHAQNQKSLQLLGQDPKSLTKKAVLETMVQESLLLQGAASAKVVVDDTTVNNYVTSELNKQKQMLEQQSGRKISEAEFNTFLKNTGVDLTQIKLNYKNMQTIKDYVEKEKKFFLAKYPKVTEADAKKQFDILVQSGQLTKPVYVKIGHIFFSTDGKKFSQVGEIQKKALQLQKDLVSGKVKYKDALKESDDKTTASKDGLLGWTAMIDPALVQIFGEETASEIVSLQKNSFSQLLESEKGFHIVYVFDRQEGGIPKFSDKRFPENSDTFKDYFMQVMEAQNKEKAFASAMEELYNELKKDAVITYYNKEYQP